MNDLNEWLSSRDAIIFLLCVVDAVTGVQPSALLIMVNV